jgi:hypothetical protein
MPATLDTGEADQENGGWRPAQADSSKTPISKITRAKWTGGVAEAVEHLLCECEALSPTPLSPIKIKKLMC